MMERSREDLIVDLLNNGLLPAVRHGLGMRQLSGYDVPVNSGAEARYHIIRILKAAQAILWPCQFAIMDFLGHSLPADPTEASDAIRDAVTDLKNVPPFPLAITIDGAIADLNTLEVAILEAVNDIPVDTSLQLVGNMISEVAQCAVESLLTHLGISEALEYEPTDLAALDVGDFDIGLLEECRFEAGRADRDAKVARAEIQAMLDETTLSDDAKGGASLLLAAIDQALQEAPHAVGQVLQDAELV